MASPSPPKKKPVGRPKQHPIIRGARQAKIYATGETKNSPMTSPNIVFILGLILILSAGFSSGRFKNLFIDIWTLPGPTGTKGSNVPSHGSDFLNQLRIVGLQLIWLFGMTIVARAAPPTARIFLIIIVGMWILYIMKNPGILQFLNAQEQQAVQQNAAANPPGQNETPQQLSNAITTLQQSVAHALQQK